MNLNLLLTAINPWILASALALWFSLIRCMYGLYCLSFTVWLDLPTTNHYVRALGLDHFFKIILIRDFPCFFFFFLLFFLLFLFCLFFVQKNNPKNLIFNSGFTEYGEMCVLNNVSICSHVAYIHWVYIPMKNKQNIRNTLAKPNTMMIQHTYGWFHRYNKMSM